MCEKQTLEAGRYTLSGIARTSIGSYNGYLSNGTYEFVILVLNGVRYYAYTDPKDDMRSMGDFVTFDTLKDDNHIYNGNDRFFQEVEETKIISIPDEEVVMTYTEDNTEYYDGANIFYTFKDALTDRVILEIGTKHLGDWYPVAIFNWYPENLDCNKDVPRHINLNELKDRSGQVLTFFMKNGDVYIAKLISVSIDNEISLLYNSYEGICVTDMVRMFILDNGMEFSSIIRTDFILLGNKGNEVSYITTVEATRLRKYNSIIENHKQNDIKYKQYENLD